MRQKIFVVIVEDEQGFKGISPDFPSLKAHSSVLEDCILVLESMIEHVAHNQSKSGIMPNILPASHWAKLYATGSIPGIQEPLYGVVIDVELN